MLPSLNEASDHGTSNQLEA